MLGLCFREYPHNIWPYVEQYLHFRTLKFPLTARMRGRSGEDAHSKKQDEMIYPLVNYFITIENHHLKWENPRPVLISLEVYGIREYTCLYGVGGVF